MLELMQDYVVYTSFVSFLSLHFNSHFPGEPWLVGVIEAKDDGSGGDNWTTGAISRAKLQSYCYHQHPVILQAGCPSCRPTNSVKALKGKYHIPWTCVLSPS